MYTVSNYDPTVVNSIKEGNTYKAKGGIAFESHQEAQEYAQVHSMLVYKLCPNCGQDTFEDAPTLKYKTMKRLLKPIKIIE